MTCRAQGRFAEQGLLLLSEHFSVRFKSSKDFAEHRGLYAEGGFKATSSLDVLDGFECLRGEL